MIKTIFTPKAPKPIGPYVQGKVIDGTLYISGQLPIGLDGMPLPGDITVLTEILMAYIHAIMETAGMNELVKVNVILKDLNDFAAFNATYQHYLTKHFPGKDFPARETIQAGIAKDMAIEMSAVAGKSEE